MTRAALEALKKGLDWMPEKVELPNEVDFNYGWNALDAVLAQIDGEPECLLCKNGNPIAARGFHYITHENGLKEPIVCSLIAPQINGTDINGELLAALKEVLDNSEVVSMKNNRHGLNIRKRAIAAISNAENAAKDKNNE